MRTHKKHGVLLAGINGHKIYYKEGKFKVVARYQILEVPSDKETIVTSYVNLKYHNVKDHEKIRNDFLNLVEGMI